MFGFLFGIRVRVLGPRYGSGSGFRLGIRGGFGFGIGLRIGYGLVVGIRFG